jgi:hypothetical protein
MKVMTNGKINEGNVKKKGRRLYKGENKEWKNRKKLKR